MSRQTQPDPPVTRSQSQPLTAPRETVIEGVRNFSFHEENPSQSKSSRNTKNTEKDPLKATSHKAIRKGKGNVVNPVKPTKVSSTSVLSFMSQDNNKNNSNQSEDQQYADHNNRDGKQIPPDQGDTNDVDQSMDEDQQQNDPPPLDKNATENPDTIMDDTSAPLVEDDEPQFYNIDTTKHVATLTLPATNAEDLKAARECLERAHLDILENDQIGPDASLIII